MSKTVGTRAVQARRDFVRGKYTRTTESVLAVKSCIIGLVNSVYNTAKTNKEHFQQYTVKKKREREKEREISGSVYLKDTRKFWSEYLMASRESNAMIPLRVKCSVMYISTVFLKLWM